MNRAVVNLSILALLGAVALAMSGMAQDGDEKPGEVGISTTHRMRPVWWPIDAPLLIDVDRILATAQDFLDDHPGDMRIELGGFADPDSYTESSYFHPSAIFYSENDFAAMNFTGLDYIYWNSLGGGAKSRDPRHDTMMIGGLDKENITPKRRSMAQWTTREHAGRRFTIASLVDRGGVAGYETAMSHVISPPAEEVLEAALQTGHDVLVAVSDYSPEGNDRWASEYDGIGLILEFAPGPPEPRRVGSTWIAPAPDRTEFQRVLLRFEEGTDTIESVSLERRRYVEDSTYEELQQYGTPAVGMRVRPEGRVAERMEVSAENVNIDVHRNVDMPSLTSAETVYVYRIREGGEDFHVYRVHHRIGRGYFPMDVLVKLDGERHVREVVTNLPSYPVVLLGTTMGDIVPQIIGRDESGWTVPADVAPGVEEHTQRFLENLRRTIELDRQLYG